MDREIHRMTSLRRDSSLWRRGDDVFSRSSSRFQDEEDDEEALRWAALERLPTFDRVRRGILMVEEGGEKVEVDVGRLGARESRALIERLVRAADDDHESFLLKLKERMDRVGIDYPTIEVRFENLGVEAEVHVGNRGLPTLVNSVTNTVEGQSIDQKQTGAGASSWHSLQVPRWRQTVFFMVTCALTREGRDEFGFLLQAVCPAAR